MPQEHALTREVGGGGGGVGGGGGGGKGRYIVLAKSTNCPNAKGPETTKDRTAFR